MVVWVRKEITRVNECFDWPMAFISGGLSYKKAEKCRRNHRTNRTQERKDR
jgi:hypothetical protein